MISLSQKHTNSTISQRTHIIAHAITALSYCKASTSQQNCPTADNAKDVSFHVLNKTVFVIVFCDSSAKVRRFMDCNKQFRENFRNLTFIILTTLPY